MNNLSGIKSIMSTLAEALPDIPDVSDKILRLPDRPFNIPEEFNVIDTPIDIPYDMTLLENALSFEILTIGFSGVFVVGIALSFLLNGLGSLIDFFEDIAE